MNVESISEAHSQAQKGVGATTLLEIMEPLVADRLTRLIDQMGQVPPELPILLDIRAKLTEIRRIQKILQRVKLEGVDAAKALREIAGD